MTVREISKIDENILSKRKNEGAQQHGDFASASFDVYVAELSRQRKSSRGRVVFLTAKG